MNEIFADAFYFIAILNPQDQYHQAATEYTQHFFPPKSRYQPEAAGLAPAEHHLRTRGICKSWREAPWLVRAGGSPLSSPGSAGREKGWR